MTKPISFGKLDVELVSSMTGTQGVPLQENPFRILIMGDFSGRANRGDYSRDAGVMRRRVLQVDRDTLDEVMARIGVELFLPLRGKVRQKSPLTLLGQ